MTMYNDIREATVAWVNSFNEIPVSLIERAYGAEMYDSFSFEFLTKTEPLYRCESCDEEFDQEEMDSIEEDENGMKYCPACADLSEIEKVDDTENDDVYRLPMWSTLFSPRNQYDQNWVLDNLQEISDLGFLIYQCDECGILLGIDSAGHDFYEAYWIPLYELRGLQWHDEEMGA